MGIELAGSYWSNLNSRSLSVFIAPCASRVIDGDGVVHGGDEDCVWDQKEVEEYLGTYSILLYNNLVEFKHNKYGEDSVQKKSVLSKRQSLANKNPSFIQTNI